VKDWMTYEKIQELKRNHLNKTQVSKRLHIDYKTVLKYWDMPPDEFATCINRAQRRKRKADDYKDFVLSCLQKYPDMNAAQIYDWIKEHAGLKKLPFRKRSFRNYVNALRKEYDIPKPESMREYEAVEDPPMGEQAQVDMGEIYLDTPSGRRKKVYGFGMVMSNSRYKYILWQERPWTTADFVQAHIKAFTFFGGRPRQIVYDQDKVLAVSENSGDIILTEGFQNYLNATGFDIFLCHGHDPESKGRIEAVIKYAKYGFAKHRTLTDIDSLNRDCLDWLERTGNAEEHGTTKKIPAEVFTIEKEYLVPVSEYSFAKPTKTSITYHVRKDNIVLYKSNRYRVPKGTYVQGKQVYVIPEGDYISIVDVDTGVLYAKHPLCTGKGELIGDQSRPYRDKSKTILEIEQSVIKLMGECDGRTALYLAQIHRNKPRYYRDQLGEIKKLFDEWDVTLIRKALDYCIEQELYSAGELSSATIYMSSLEDEKHNKTILRIGRLPEKYRGESPSVRDLRVYEEAMERRIVNG
jgi:Transposase and inactivated derivatives